MTHSPVSAGLFLDRPRLRNRKSASSITPATHVEGDLSERENRDKLGELCRHVTARFGDEVCM
jgi:hypothetical protein